MAKPTTRATVPTATLQATTLEIATQAEPDVQGIEPHAPAELAPQGTFSEIDQDEAFEMIELAIGDLDTLGRAFELIAQLCEGREELNDQDEDQGTESSETIIH